MTNEFDDNAEREFANLVIDFRRLFVASESPSNPTPFSTKPESASLTSGEGLVFTALKIKKKQRSRTRLEEDCKKC